MILEISEHGSSLRRNHDCFIIQTPSAKTEVPAEKVDAILVTANASISTQAVVLCLEKEIQLVLADWAGRPIGRFWASTPGRTTETRRQQYKNQDTVLAFDICKDLVRKKLAGQRKLLIALKNNRSEADPKLAKSIELIGGILKKVGGLSFTGLFKETLLGLEGTAAAAYFEAISASLPVKYAFKERSKNPATDPFNAVLNYSYGIAYSAVEKIIILS
ncbi:CRISPR-associated endonuclease Cas1, partial [Candidatus Micrarchaeota archaeon]|nr:CRISPR-associated endonuclease Cas1 [Candidatus Micrarchaeota archaeon]